MIKTWLNLSPLEFSVRREWTYTRLVGNKLWILQLQILKRFLVNLFVKWRFHLYLRQGKLQPIGEAREDKVVMTPQISSIPCCFVFREAVSQTKCCWSLKLKIFVPTKIFGLATPLLQPHQPWQEFLDLMPRCSNVSVGRQPLSLKPA